MAFAQIDQGGITGTISDQTGRAIQGASITIVNKDTNLSFTRLSGADGVYSFSPIEIGTYTLTVSAQLMLHIRQPIRGRQDRDSANTAFDCSGPVP